MPSISVQVGSMLGICGPRGFTWSIRPNRPILKGHWFEGIAQHLGCQTSLLEVGGYRTSWLL